MKQKKPRLWIAREQACGDAQCDYAATPIRPGFGVGGLHPPGDVALWWMCADQFERMTGIHLEPGEYVQVKEILVGDVRKAQP